MEEMKLVDFVSRRTMIGTMAFTAVQRAFGQPTPVERLFTFRQSSWLNLHHFLYVLGRARNNEPDSRRGAVAGAVADGREILDLPEPESKKASLLCHPRFDAEVREALWTAAPIYRRVWWARHSAANQERTVELQRLIAQYGDAIAREVSRPIARHGRRPASASI
jgi:hypothetical protein